MAGKFRLITIEVSIASSQVPPQHLKGCNKALTQTHLLTKGSENVYRLSSTGTVETTEGTIC
jgi:hypothetical protein